MAGCYQQTIWFLHGLHRKKHTLEKAKSDIIWVNMLAHNSQKRTPYIVWFAQNTTGIEPIKNGSGYVSFCRENTCDQQQVVTARFPLGLC